MSETRTNLASHVSEKLAAMRAKIGEAANGEAKFEIYDNYNIHFTGVKAGVDAAGVSAADRAPVDKALAYIASSLSALEAELDLESALA